MSTPLLVFIGCVIGNSLGALFLGGPPQQVLDAAFFQGLALGLVWWFDYRGGKR